MAPDIYVKLLLIFLTLNVTLAFETSANASLLPCKKDSEQDLNSPYHKITDCHRKIRIAVDLYNTKKTPEGLEFIYVKEVANPSTGVRMRLLNPVVIRLRQTQVVLAYPFKYLSAVNGRAKEIVVNYQNRKNYTGCDDTSSIRPTCGIKHERGISVPYSEGFCCFCPDEATKEKQTRGGQDCSLEVQEDDFDKQRYKASAHCLRFNDVWYSVSALSDPIIIHDISLQVYNQRFLANGSEVWVSLTHEEEFEIGNKNPFQFDENKTIVASFYTNSPKNGTLLISSDDNRLLIPQPMPGVPVEKLPPPVKNGAGDYLLLSKSVIDSTGEACNKAGISFAAFAKQPNRCDVVKDTCLKNQPLEFWDADDELRRSGQKGSYLLENYGVPYKTPIIIDKETKEHWLALEYYEKQHSRITIEFNADNVVALTPGKRVQISLVISASFEKKIDFFVTVANKDLSPATLEVQVSKCGYRVSDTSTISKIVPPQLSEEFLLSTVPGDIELVDRFTCTVAVNSSAYGTVATRKVTVKPLQRCICNMHCQCACLFESLKCEPMPVKEFHAAGFRGSPPLLTAKVEKKAWIWEYPLLFLLALLILLLLIGYAKAIYGYAGHKKVAHFGLKNMIFRPCKIKRYLEPNLKKMEVTYDDEGYPVYPNTNRRAQILSEKIIFLLNIFFFFVWPLKQIVDCCRGLKTTQKSDSPSEKSGEDSNEDRETNDTEGGSQSGNEDSTGENISLQSINLQSPDSTDRTSSLENQEMSYLESQERFERQEDVPSERIVPKYSISDSDLSGSKIRVSDPKTSSFSANHPSFFAEQPLRRMHSAVSESMLEFVESEHHGELPNINKEITRWQKGTAKINAFKLRDQTDEES